MRGVSFLFFKVFQIFLALKKGLDVTQPELKGSYNCSPTSRS